MKSRSTQWFKQIGTGLIILIMGMMLVNKAVYTHVHFLPDGSVATHAHPFSSGTNSQNNSSHQHSATELFLLDQLDVLMVSVFAVFALKRYCQATQLSEATKDRLLPGLVPLSPGRAPPSCM